MRSKGFIDRVADRLEIAFDATRLACLAALATVPDQLVRKIDPRFLGDGLHQILLDFWWVIVAGEVEAARDAAHVGIDDDAKGKSVAGAQNDVRSFARNAWKRQDVFHGLRDITFEFIDQPAACAHDRFGLIAKKTGGANILLEFARSGVGECFNGRIFLIQRGRDFVDPLVGTLRGQNCGD